MPRKIICLVCHLLLVPCIFLKVAPAQQPPACVKQELASWCSSVSSSWTPSCANCPKSYVVKSYQGQNRCLDYTPEVEGSPIIINDCAKAHPVVVEELADGKHTVVLHAGTKIIGVEEGPVVAAATAVSREAAAASEKPLQLLGLSTRPGAVSIGSYFTLDGDSIIFSGNRNLVVKVQNARGAAGSPVVLGGRQLSDNEFWDFTPTAGSALDPTSGFVRIGYAGDPNCANPAMCVCRFFNVLAAAGEGTVMKLGSLLDLTEPMILLPEGNNDIRITGLNLTGPSRATDDPQTKAIGVLTFDANLRNIIDNNGISGWPYIGVMTKAHDDLDIKGNSKCDPNSVHDPQVRQTSALVARNFIEYNRQQNAGYGTESDWGAYPFILGNTFVSNRHAIAGGKGSAHTAYRAWNNLVLSAAPLQHDILGDKHWTHDFDMHGMGNDGFGGIGGDYVDIYENTFLGTSFAATCVTTLNSITTSRWRARAMRSRGIPAKFRWSIAFGPLRMRATNGGFLPIPTSSVIPIRRPGKGHLGWEILTATRPTICSWPRERAGIIRRREKRLGDF